MTCIGAVKRFLVRLGVMPSFTDDEFKEAETENIVKEREQAMSQLQEKYATFASKSERVVQAVEQNDLQSLLNDIRKMSVPADARTLFENMITHRVRR